MQNIIENALDNSFSYLEYRQLVSKLISEGKSTGHNQTEALLQYSELNETRMNRLEKTLKVPQELTEKLNNLTKDYIWLTISEGWCGDAAQIIPILHKLEEVSNKVELKLVLRDDNDELMQLYLTNGSKSIPKVIILEKETKEVITSWGPRPEPARKLIADYKAQHGVVDEPVKIELQKWYLHDKGLTTMKELVELL
ncbi:thioredoxin family protein [Flavobacterium okayamense]|uniref:Thioredoxin n=1 Tax=Flavobacterium okayamense TaxID=2830782 RepID=A0ABN6HU32_9FLAO|nr:thioredoxin family protein [Flavobacterium okayamense]BCY28023.1 thioredoxin [Flavobacterium okayamense]